MATEGDHATPDSPGAWMTLQEAGACLGVSASTVRRWADAGRLPSQRTPGGHRRLAAAAVESLARERRPATSPAPGARWSLGPPPAQQAWYVQLHGSPVGGQMRELGQRLLGLLIQYLIWQGDDSRFLADAHAVGVQYGAAARVAGASLSETVQAFLYFRRTFWRMALQIPPMAQATDMAEMVRLSERIDHFTDGVLLRTIAGYEQAAGPSLLE